MFQHVRKMCVHMWNDEALMLVLKSLKNAIFTNAQVPLVMAFIRRATVNVGLVLWRIAEVQI